tara:strand:- start:325 stop:504 length:180 start_codon:yes stop_codon:yes gene_type:complete
MKARYTKKKLRAMLVLSSDDRKMRKMKINRMTWGYLRMKYTGWFNSFSIKDRKKSNAIK